jgi:methyl-accepting chemotaxis protein
MTSIPGASGYQIRDGNFIAPDGKALTQQHFVDKVKSKEISLTADSLQFLDKHLGSDTMQSLRQSTSPSTLQNVSARLQSTEANMGEIYDLMKVIAQFSQTQRQSASAIRQAHYDSQISGMKKSADDLMAAAWSRLAGGILSGAATITSGAVQIGSVKLGTDLKGADGKVDPVKKMEFQVDMSKVEGKAKAIDGTAKLLSTGGEFAANAFERNSKDGDMSAKKAEQAAQKINELLETIREMSSRAMETFQATVQSNREMPKV